MSQQREFYRIKYPITQRPRLVLGSCEVEIIELSENGARVAFDIDADLLNSEPFDAAIAFQDGTIAVITARAIRCKPDQAVLQFTHNLPYSIIAAQQRRLLQMFPREAAV